MMRNKITALLMVITMLWGTSFAEVVPLHELNINSETILHIGQVDLRGKITHSLEDKEFVKKLSELGIDKNEVELRLAAMTDSELNQVVNASNREAGGEVIIVTTGLILLVLLVVLLLRTLRRTDGGSNGSGTVTVIK